MLVPFFGFPSLFGFVLHPAILFLTGAAVLLFSRPIALASTWTLLDTLVTLYLLGMALSVLRGVQPIGYFLSVSCLIAGPYFGGKAIAQWLGVGVILRALAIAGLLAAPFVAIELASGNPFRALFPYVAAADLADGAGGLGSVMTRLDVTRAQGALGQPIPFAIAMTSSAVAALAMWSYGPTRNRSAWLLVAAICVCAQATALARSGWLVLLVAGLTALAIAPRRLVRSRNSAVFATLGLILVTVLAVAPVRQLLFGGGSALEQEKLSASAQYRQQLFDEALTPGVLQPFGSAAKFRTYLDTGSIDNAFIEVAFHWGWLPVLALAGLALCVVRRLLAARRRPLSEVFLLALLAGTFVALWNVAFIGQQALIFWMLLGVASSLGPGLAGAPAAAEQGDVAPSRSPLDSALRAVTTEGAPRRDEEPEPPPHR